MHEAGREDRVKGERESKNKKYVAKFSAKCTSDKHHTLTGAETAATQQLSIAEEIELLLLHKVDGKREREKTFSSLMNRYQFK